MSRTDSEPQWGAHRVALDLMVSRVQSEMLTLMEAIPGWREILELFPDNYKTVLVFRMSIWLLSQGGRKEGEREWDNRNIRLPFVLSPIRTDEDSVNAVREFARKAYALVKAAEPPELRLVEANETSDSDAARDYFHNRRPFSGQV